MTLSDYLRATKQTDAQFGERIGLSRSAVSRIRRGLADPPLSTIRKIVAASDGLVSFERGAAVRNSADVVPSLAEATP